MIEGHGFTVIRSNPEAANAINRLRNRIYKHIIKSTNRQTKKSDKKSLIDDLSKRLLKSEFKPDHSIKSKSLKWAVKKKLPPLVEYDKHCFK